jgi:hypothetical protein
MIADRKGAGRVLVAGEAVREAFGHRSFLLLTAA